MKLIRTRRARQDLIEIWRHVAENDPEAADSLLDAIDAKCRLLVGHPNLGPARDDIREGLRYLRAGHYLVLYQVDGRLVRIVRVLHGRRDLHGAFST